MNTQKKYYIGVDVSKDKLDFYHPKTKSSWTVPNTPSKVKSELLKLSKQQDQIHIICEPTGGYEKCILAQAWELNIPISLVNPNRARAFAEALGIVAKTDAIDSMVLSRFGESIEPKSRIKPTALQEEMSAVTRIKDRFTRQAAAQKTALQKVSESFVRKELKTQIQNLERAIARCQKQLDTLIKSDAELFEKKRKIESIKGLGLAASTVFLSEMPELGTITDNQASALVGVAPFNKDTGTHSGKRHVRGGRHLLRRSLYMPALCATNHNPILKGFYDRLIAKGKPHHVAIIAVIRKLVRLVNRLLSDPNFEPIKQN